MSKTTPKIIKKHNLLIDVYKLYQLKSIGKKLSKATSTKRSKQQKILSIIEVHKILNDVYVDYLKHKNKPIHYNYFDTDTNDLIDLSHKEINSLFDMYRKLCLSANGRTKTSCAKHLRWLMVYANNLKKELK